MNARLLLVAIFVAGCASKRTPPTTTTSTTNAEMDCEGCHRAEAEEWRASMHRVSFTSADFQRSYRAEPRDYCVSCHAPGRDRAAGIGCNSCHTVSEGHRVVTTAAECKTCHDFNVPGTHAILQSTAREQQESASFATTPCVDCHMQAGSQLKHRDHRFNVTRNASFLGAALRVHSAQIDKDAIVVRLATNRVGHRFPTGDIYRRLTITLTAFDKDNGVIAGETFHLNRDWDEHRRSQHSGRLEPMIDNRLTEAPREFRIACATKPERVHLTVDYERGSSAEGDFFEAFDRLEILDTDVSVTR